MNTIPAISTGLKPKRATSGDAPLAERMISPASGR